MTDTAKMIATLPVFASEDEERDFWDTHDSTDYLDGTEDVTHNPPPNLREGPGQAGSTARKRPADQFETVSFPLLKTQLAAIRTLAEREGVPYDVLLRWWIADRLAQERDATP